MAEPEDRNHRDLVDRAVDRIARMPPRDLLPSNAQLGEELARSVSRVKTRNRVVRLMASEYALNAGPPAGGGPSDVERTLTVHMERFAREIGDYRPEKLVSAVGRIADDYFDAYVKDIEGLARWLLFCAIATVPGPLETDDRRDQAEFQDVIAGWLKAHTDRYQVRYAELIAALGRIDRQGDGFRSLAHLLGMLSEGVFLRVAIDPSIGHDETRRMYRQAVLGLVAVYSARADDDRTVDQLIAEAFEPS